MKKSRKFYIEANDADKPCATIEYLMKEISDDLFSNLEFSPGLTTLKSRGKKKIKITLIIEESD